MLCAMPLMLPPASHCTRISFTSATRILLRPIDHLRLRCGHGRGHLLRTGRWQIVVNSYLVNSDEQKPTSPWQITANSDINKCLRETDTGTAEFVHARGARSSGDQSDERSA